MYFAALVESVEGFRFSYVNETRKKLRDNLQIHNKNISSLNVGNSLLAVFNIEKGEGVSGGCLNKFCP